MARTYPTDVKVFIDDLDVTKMIFGEDTITLTDLQNTWRNIDITPYVRYAGLHKLRITAAAGVGRVEARVAIT
jgi:hypothetical protein